MQAVVNMEAMALPAATRPSHKSGLTVQGHRSKFLGLDSVMLLRHNKVVFPVCATALDFGNFGWHELRIGNTSRKAVAAMAQIARFIV
jgi:hypothetical protein